MSLTRNDKGKKAQARSGSRRSKTKLVKTRPKSKHS